MQTWEMITAIGSIQKTPLRIYSLPDGKSSADRDAWLTTQFDLEPSMVEIIHCEDVRNDSPMLERDARIVRDADIIIPISIRRSGAMATLLEAAQAERKQIVEDFRSLYRDRTAPLAYEINAGDLNPELSTLTGRYVFHWTRAANTAWPGERLVDYYRDIIASEHYPRTAFDTLCRILNEQRLLASSRHMPEKTPTVSFTGLSPEEAAPLMRWRARYSEMSFEPYGIGIDTSACDRAGIQPVRYLDKSNSDAGKSDDLWLTQSIGVVTDWRQEKEYRHRGDLSLAQLPPDQLIVVTRTPNEAREIQKRFQLKAIPFCRL